MTELLPVLTLVGGLLFGLITGFPMAFTLSSSAIVTAFFFFGAQTLPFVATDSFLRAN